MRNGTCDGCGGTEVYAVANGLDFNTGTRVALHGYIPPGFRGVRPHHMSDGVWQYLCAACGKLEIYVFDGAAIDFVRRHWVRVPPGG